LTFELQHDEYEMTLGQEALSVAIGANRSAGQLRQELAARNRTYGRGRPHVESYGQSRVVVYAPEEKRHGNFFDPAYAAITARPDWMRRFDKVHAQARSLPKAERRWRELDSSMSSDALLMSVFCTPEVGRSPEVRSMLGVDTDDLPVFGWRARVPFANGRVDRTEVDMRWGSLLVEAKLTELDFQACKSKLVEGYRDLDAVFERELLPRFKIAVGRRKRSVEFPEEYTQEEMRIPAEEWEPLLWEVAPESVDGYASYQLIRNVLAAYATDASFCVIHDERRPDLREAWFRVMSAVQSAEMRVRLKILTWQELCAVLPQALQEFLDKKYGIVPPGCKPWPVDSG
jgi:hypothetical protein